MGTLLFSHNIQFISEKSGDLTRCARVNYKTIILNGEMAGIFTGRKSCTQEDKRCRSPLFQNF